MSMPAALVLDALPKDVSDLIAARVFASAMAASPRGMSALTATQEAASDAKASIVKSASAASAATLPVIVALL